MLFNNYCDQIRCCVNYRMMYPLCCILFFISSGYTSTILVQPTLRGTFNSTLEYYLCSSESSLSDTALVLISNGNHIISPGPTCVLYDIHNLLVTSNETATVVCQTAPAGPFTNRGFAFVSGTNITFSNIIFENCGEVVDDEVLYFTNDKLQAAFLFLYTNIISLSKVSILRYNGYALLAVESSANFDDITVSMSGSASCGSNQSTTNLCSVSGIGFLFCDSNYGGTDSVNISITNSVFMSNINYPPVDGTITQYGKAGGISIMATNVSFTLYVAVKNCYFENTTGTDGGVSIVLSDGTMLSSIEFVNCTFNGNIHPNVLSTPITGSGVSLIVYNILNDITVTISNSTFKNYPADLVPIMYFNIKQSHAFEFKLKNVTCRQNMVATFVYIECIGEYCETDTAVVIFEDIKVENNHYNPYKGILLLKQVENVYFIGTIPNAFVFRNNFGSSIQCTSCNIHLMGYLNFLNNSANSGTVIHGIDSFIYFTEGLNAQFIGNHAETFSSVILMKTNAASGHCSFQFNLTERYVYHFNKSLPNINMTLYNNHAPFDGNIIFADQIYNCTQYYTSNLIIQESQLSHMYYQLFNASSPYDISSVSVSVCVCNTTETTPQCSNTTDNLHYYAYPGRTLYINVLSINGINERTFGIVVITFNTSWTVKTLEFVQLTIPTECNQLPFTISTNLTKQTGTLVLGTLSYQPSIFATVYMDDCPIGYKLSDQLCICDPLLAKIGATCDVANGTISVPLTVWVGSDNGKTAISNDCPINFCKVLSNPAIISIEDSLCINSRQGTVCGECITNYSVVFGGRICTKCSNYWLFTLILFAVAGLLLICILFLLRISISSGITTGLIFYANLFASTSRFTLDDIDFIPGKIVFVWINLMNLSLGFPMCFFDGMTELYKTGLQFVFPLYLIMIVIAFIICSHYSTKLSKLTSHYSVQVLATLIFLSYSKVSNASINSLFFVRVETDDDISYRWYANANIYYFKDGRHVILGVVSIGILLFIVLPYTISMTVLPFMYKYRLVNRIRPFLDAHFGPYKTKYQWWFSVRLWLIFIIAVLSSVLTGNWYHYLILVEGILLTGFAIIQAHIKPFQNKVVNMLDLLIIFDYITGLMVVMTQLFSYTYELVMLALYIGGVLVGAMFLLFCGMIIYQVIVVTKCMEKCKKKKKLQKFDSNIANTSSEGYMTIVSPDLSHESLNDLSSGPPILRESLLSENYIKITSD